MRSGVGVISIFTFVLLTNASYLAVIQEASAMHLPSIQEGNDHFYMLTIILYWF
jgi:hypothetical protein